MAQFKAKARAIELLGKGQIADLPTAITELFKNGYDAYAKNLICSLYLELYKDNENPVFLLSDDGFGMSKSDILEKWFVLGTDSKARGETIEPCFGLDKRTPMGEKGIGRLSVSYLGNQMLMLSKKLGEPANALLMDWRILDNYNSYLADLNIPIFIFSDITTFKNKFDEAKNAFEANLDNNLWQGQEDYQKEILSDLNSLAIPSFLCNEVISEFCKKEYHGTTFIVFTPHYQLLELSEIHRQSTGLDSSLNYLRASLSGLHNDLENPSRDFGTQFLVYDPSGKYDIIKDFFTQEEMRNADHWCKGKFDENGFFEGELRILNRRFKHTFKPTRPPGIAAYGPFPIEWGFMEGDRKNSILNEEQFRNINEKLSALGGLYIYRDNFRVLPYGRPETDFLEFEERRSRGAGYYFFSHRRLIGYIDISREKNSGLKDKAGREGFIQNKAYRDFRNDLKAFFIDIAVRYMRKTKEGEPDTYREEQLEEINAKYKQQSEAAKKKNTRTKKAFIDALKNGKERIKSIRDEIDTLHRNLEEESARLEINYNNYNKLQSVLTDKIVELRKLKLQKPRGIKIPTRKEEEYFAFRKEYFKAEDRVKSCIGIIEETRTRINIENLKTEFNEKFRSHIKSLEKQFAEYQTISKDSLNQIYHLIGEEKNAQIESFVEQTELIKLLESDKKEDIAAKINALDRLSEEQNNDISNSIGGFANHISNLQIDVDDDFLRGWYEEQAEKLQKRLEDYEELAQLGMAIEIIDHQFNVMYSQMNDAVHELDRYAKANLEMESSFGQLKSAFQHLEANYKLLKPLYRTRRRTRELIKGKQLEDYIQLFFANDFQRYRIDFSVDNAFRNYEFFTYDSIIKPVFINIINNANYWLIPVEDRKIRIEYKDGKILIMNSGERIDETLLEDIFTLFFTRKKDGRGIGLYLAKKNLNVIGYDIFASNDEKYNKFKGACFIIEKLNVSNV